MARGITQTQVNDAADALLQRGVRPTIEKLRAELGTGSPNTLTRMIEVWWAGLSERLAAQTRADLPGVPEAVQRAMMTLWTEAVVETRREAERRLAEREQALVSREAEMQAQIEASKSAEAAAAADLSRAKADLALAETALAKEREHAVALQSSLSEAVQSVRDAQGTIEAMRRAGEEAQRRFRTDVERAAAGEQRWLTEVDRAREETKAAVRGGKQARAELARERQQRLKLEAKHSAELREFKQKLAASEKALRAAHRTKPSTAARKKSATAAKSGKRRAKAAAR